MGKRTILPVLLAAILVLSLAVLTWKVLFREDKEVVTLTVWEGEKSVLHLPLYVALEEGYFDEQEIKVHLIGGPVKPGEYNPAPGADLVFTDPVAYLFHKPLQPSLPKIVAIIAGRDGTFLLAREQEDFHWANLKGKTVICLPPETGSGLLLEKILRGNGLAPYRDTGMYNRIPPDLQLSAFQSGSGDYIQLAGLDAVATEKNGSASIVTALGEKANALPPVICTALPQTIKNNPHALQEFVNGLYKAQLYMEKEPELGRKAVNRYFKANRQAASDVFVRYMKMDMWPPQPWMEKSAFNGMTQAMEASGQLPGPVSFSDAVDVSFARRAAETIQYIPPEDRKKNWLQKLFR